MTIKLKGIVLESFDFEQNDKIVTIYSNKFGKISFIAKGVNKQESKNRYSIQTHSYSEYEIFKARHTSSLSKLKTGTIIASHIQIATKTDNYLYTSLINSLILHNFPTHTKNYRFFYSLTLFLDEMTKTDSPFTLVTLFLIDIVAILGGKWQLTRCCRCEKKQIRYRTFSFQEFGLICANCWLEKDLILKQEFVEYLIWVHNNNFEARLKLNIEPIYAIVIMKYLLITIEQNLGIYSKVISLVLAKKFLADEIIEKHTHSMLT